MANTGLTDRINRKLAEEFETDISDITPDAPLMQTLDLDSLDMIDIVVLVEQNFGLTLKPEDFASIRTFGDFYDFIEKHINNAEK